MDRSRKVSGDARVLRLMQRLRLELAGEIDGETRHGRQAGLAFVRPILTLPSLGLAIGDKKTPAPRGAGVQDASSANGEERVSRRAVDAEVMASKGIRRLTGMRRVSLPGRKP